MIALSGLLNAVKPKERTDQYRILAALFALNGHVAPVEAKQVRDLLNLHLGKATPKNVNASLRKYTAYVEPAAKGPPLLWTLNAAGLDRLRTLSGLALSTVSTENEFDTDIAFVCALQTPELDALLEAAGGAQSWSDVGSPRYPHVYRSTTLTTKKGKSLKVVATTPTSMGLTAAAIATSHLIMQFRPRMVMMVGIAAGTYAGNKEFGDVLVADPSIDYNSGKVVSEGGIRDFQPDPYPIGLNPRLRSVLNKYRADPTLFDEIRAKWKGKLPKTKNRIHVGPVGAADQVIDDASKILEIQRNWRKLIGVEMETYAVYRACHEAPEPKPRFVSFKSVCDFAARKSDSWQGYAAYVAAEVAVGFLTSEWETLWPTLD